jgi:hypothetical protein
VPRRDHIICTLYSILHCRHWILVIKFENKIKIEILWLSVLMFMAIIWYHIIFYFSHWYFQLNIQITTRPNPVIFPILLPCQLENTHATHNNVSQCPFVWLLRWLNSGQLINLVTGCLLFCWISPSGGRVLFMESGSFISISTHIGCLFADGDLDRAWGWDICLTDGLTNSLCNYIGICVFLKASHGDQLTNN